MEYNKLKELFSLMKEFKIESLEVDNIKVKMSDLSFQKELKYSPSPSKEKEETQSEAYKFYNSSVTFTPKQIQED